MLLCLLRRPAVARSPRVSLTALLATTLTSCADTESGFRTAARVVDPEPALEHDDELDDLVEAAPFAGCDEIHPDRTVGLRMCTDGVDPGYTLVAPLLSTMTFLIDERGEVVHRWEADSLPNASVELLADGRLLRTSTSRGVELYDWDGGLLWSLDVGATTGDIPHHDAEAMPNGNILILAWEWIEPDEAMAAGWKPEGAPSPLLVDYVIEVDPRTDEVVWEWHMWDHIVQDVDPAKPHFAAPGDAPGRIDLNGVTGWPDSHVNSVSYNAELDQVLLSTSAMMEVWVIDHSTTTAEAAGRTGGVHGRGGDLLYRWGNNEMIDAPGPGPLGPIHDGHWIPPGHPGAGNILIFANTYGEHSAVLEIEPPLLDDGSYEHVPGLDFGPAAPVWTGTVEGLFSQLGSSAQRLPNGNTLICAQNQGRLVEVTPEGDTVWEYVNPLRFGEPVPQGTEVGHGWDHGVFRALRYPRDHAAFVGRDLTSAGPLELAAQ